MENRCLSFKLEDDAYIHVIKTGFEDTYIIVHEDAYEQTLGNTIVLNKNEIENTFKVEINFDSQLDVSILDKFCLYDIVTYLEKKYGVDDILDQISNQKVISYLTDEDYFVADDEDDAVEILMRSGNIDLPFEGLGDELPNFRKDDCKELIEQILERKGWNVLYAILEPYKDAFNIV